MRIDGRGSKASASRATAFGAPRPIRWCGQDDVLTAKSFLLRAAMVYYSLGTPLEDEPSCIDLDLDAQPPGRFAEPEPSTYPTYAGMSPGYRAQYLYWLSKNRTSSIGHIGFALLYLCGLERRIFLDRADLPHVVKEVVRLRAAHSSTRVFGLHANQFLAFALAGLGLEPSNSPLMELAFEKPPAHCTKDDIAVALSWFCAAQIPLPASWAWAIASHDRRLPTTPSLASKIEQPASLFNTRYRERFDRGIRLKRSSADRQIHYQPVNASLHFHEQSENRPNWSITIPDLLNDEAQFAPLRTLIAQVIGEAPPTAVPAKTALRSPAPGYLGLSAASAKPQAPAAAQPQARPLTKLAPLRWQGTAGAISVRGYLLRNPMVYISDGAPAVADLSCIDTTLAIGNPSARATKGLGFHPNYAELNPDERASYLSWLASGRTRPLSDIGYAFLFFFGLERRVLVDGQDKLPVILECLRLLETYTFSGAFNVQLSSFIVHTLATVGLETITTEWFERIFEKSRLSRHDDSLATALAWFYKKHAPLPASWALRFGRRVFAARASFPAHRLAEQFNSLFESRYRDAFGAGLVLKASKYDRSIAYQPASPLLRHDNRLSGILPGGGAAKIPDVLTRLSQIQALATLWSRCITELKPVSRVLARGSNLQSRDAYDALPKELKATVPHPDQEKWNRITIEHFGRDECAVVAVSSLAELQEIPERARLTRRQSEDLAHTAQAVGLMIEPDTRLTGQTYAWNDHVSLVRPKHAEEFARPHENSRYPAASLVLALGIHLAAVGGSVDDAQADQAVRFVESQFQLAPSEERRLHALKRAFAASPPTLAGLSKPLRSSLTLEERAEAGQFLTRIAAADGIIDRKELSALKHAYRALDLSIEQLNEVIEELSRSIDGPVQVLDGEASAFDGEIIPPRPQPAILALDEQRLAAILSETEVVIETLRNAMLEPGQADESPAVAAGLPGNQPRVEGLDSRYHSMLAQLLVRSVWHRDDFNSLARACNVMPSGALDALNDWACELFNDQLLFEQDDQIEIQTQLLETS